MRESYLYHDYVDVYDVTCFGKATLKDFAVKNSSLEFTKGKVFLFMIFLMVLSCKKTKTIFVCAQFFIKCQIDRSDFSSPVLLKNGVSTKHKNERLMNEKAVEHKISMAFTNQNKNSVFSKEKMM